MRIFNYLRAPATHSAFGRRPSVYSSPPAVLSRHTRALAGEQPSIMASEKELEVKLEQVQDSIAAQGGQVKALKDQVKTKKKAKARPAPHCASTGTTATYQPRCCVHGNAVTVADTEHPSLAHAQERRQQHPRRSQAHDQLPMCRRTRRTWTRRWRARWTSSKR